jgi:hypothetical protein
MPGLWKRQPNRRRARPQARNHFRPYLEELEPRTVFAVGIAPLPGALAAAALTSPLTAVSPSQVAIVSAPTATPAQSGLPATPPALNALGAFPLPANLGQPPAVPPGAFPAQPVAAQTTTAAPAGLPPDSTAPLSVLSYADYQLSHGLNASLPSGQLPTILNTPGVNALFEVGGNAGGVSASPTPASPGDSAVVPAGAGVPGNALPADVSPAPEDDGPMSSLLFRRPARPAADYPKARADDGPAAPQGAALVGDPQAPLQAEAPAAAAGVDE